MNKPTTPAAIAFIAKGPALLGRVHGVDLYEHPTQGDEAPIYAVTANGRLIRTDHWEVPCAEEATDLIDL